MTSTYDHRIIQGAESGQFLQVVEAYLQGEHGFYEQVFSDLGVAMRPRRRCPPRPRRRRRQPAAEPAASPTSSCCRPSGGDVADQGAPHARPPGRACGCT